jgi:hypothetical protein
MIPGSSSAQFFGAAGAAGGYQIERSLRFNSSDSAYLSRTPASAGNRKTWTWAGWVKRADVTPAVGNASQAFFSVYNGGAYFIAGFDGDNLIDVLASTGGRATTTATYRDPSAWYHIVVSLDASNATQANRCLIYVNGVQQALGAATFTDTEYSVNLAVEHQIGTYNTTGRLLATAT